MMQEHSLIVKLVDGSGRIVPVKVNKFIPCPVSIATNTSVSDVVLGRPGRRNTPSIPRITTEQTQCTAMGKGCVSVETMTTELLPGYSSGTIEISPEMPGARPRLKPGARPRLKPSLHCFESNPSIEMEVEAMPMPSQQDSATTGQSSETNDLDPDRGSCENLLRQTSTDNLSSSFLVSTSSPTSILASKSSSLSIILDTSSSTDILPTSDSDEPSVADSVASQYSCAVVEDPYISDTSSSAVTFFHSITDFNDDDGGVHTMEVEAEVELGDVPLVDESAVIPGSGSEAVSPEQNLFGTSNNEAASPEQSLFGTSNALTVSDVDTVGTVTNELIMTNSSLTDLASEDCVTSSVNTSLEGTWDTTEDMHGKQEQLAQDLVTPDPVEEDGVAVSPPCSVFASELSFESPEHVPLSDLPSENTLQLSVGTDEECYVCVDSNTGNLVYINSKGEAFMALSGHTPALHQQELQAAQLSIAGDSEDQSGPEVSLLSDLPNIETVPEVSVLEEVGAETVVVTTVTPKHQATPSARSRNVHVVHTNSHLPLQNNAEGINWSDVWLSGNGSSTTLVNTADNPDLPDSFTSKEEEVLVMTTQLRTIREFNKRERDRLTKRELRKNDDFRLKEKIKAKERMKAKRSDPDYRKMERDRDKLRRRQARCENEEQRMRERDRDKVHKRRLRPPQTLPPQMSGEDYLKIHLIATKASKWTV